MDLNRMIAELQAEKERLDEAILALERLVASKGKRRGRPPKWLAPTGSNNDSAHADGHLEGVGRASGKHA